MAILVKPRTRARGFSVTELTMVVAIVGTISVLVAGGMERSQTFANVEMSRGALESRFQHSLDRVRSTLAIARVEAPFDSGTRIRFMTPVDHDGDGSTYDATGAVTWGSTGAGVATLGEARWLQYVVSASAMESTLQFDVNGDGDQLDAFDLGHLEELSNDGSIVRWTAPEILQKADDPGGDIDEDGVLDPLFSIIDSGRSRLARIRVFGLVTLPNGRFQRVDYDVSVRLQNDEQ